MKQAWGRYFSRNPETGVKRASAEVFSAEAPVRQPLLALQQSFPQASAQLQQAAQEAEQALGDAVLLEFVLESDNLSHTARPLPRSPQAACKIAVALVLEGLLTPEQAILRIEPEDLRAMLAPALEDGAQEALAQGRPLVPGAASGRIVLTADEALAAADPVILLCERLGYAQRKALHRLEGLIVRSGAALAARHLECPCLQLDQIQLEAGQRVSLDGGTGRLYAGDLPVGGGLLSADACTLLEWAAPLVPLEIRANVSGLEEARLASAWGAQGIGLFRIEGIVLHPRRLPLFQTVLHQVCQQQLPDSPDYEQLVRELTGDIVELLDATQGPFNIRLLDSPLAQMLDFWQASSELPEDYFAGRLGDWLLELNPMQGLRCGRLSLLYPRLLEIQLRGILGAWKDTRRRLQVMLPGTCDAQEIVHFRQCLKKVAAELSCPLPEVGSMLEIPRACLLAEELAEQADFLSFGTGDLTEATCGISRYDAPISFLPHYLSQGIFERDPFEAIDQRGVGALMRIASQQVKARCPSVEIGTCGAQAVDPESLQFCMQLGLNYVSVPTRHLPVARLAAAQTTLRSGSPRHPLPRLRRN
ncbi:MAG: putative PEP-binding protein [Vulcanimicrobiota bacterium]